MAINTILSFSNGTCTIDGNATTWTLKDGKTIKGKVTNPDAFLAKLQGGSDLPIKCAPGCVYKGKIYAKPSQSSLENMLRRSLTDCSVKGIDGSRVEADSPLSWLRILGWI